MKKLFLSLLVAGPAIAASALPQGKFSGEGTWISPDGKTGKYAVTTEIRGNRVSSEFETPVGKKTFTFDAVFSPSGFFKAKEEGHELGGGYCFDSHCHYEIKIGHFSLEETLLFRDGGLTRLGSKVYEGKPVAWKEVLK